MHADDPRHGTTKGYAAHYQDAETPCAACADAARAYKRYRYRLIAYGRWQPFADAEPVRAHILWLQSQGMGWRRIAEASGVARDTVSNIAYPKGGKPQQTVRTQNAGAILAVEPDPWKLPALGTSRRLRALAAIGYTGYDIAARLGVRQSTTRYWYAGTGNVERETVGRIAQLYDELCMTPGPSNSARIRATKKGWAPPLAWSDIDDPDEKPDTGRRPYYSEQESYDHAVVERIMSGDFGVYATRAERREIVRRWMAKGLALKDLERETGWRTHRYLTERAA